MRVLSPLGTTPDTVKSLAKRRPSLGGLRIGVLDNSKPNADVLLDRVAEALAASPAAPASTPRWCRPSAPLAR